MSGPHFRDYHLLLDEQADQIFASIDPLAERVRKIGQTTLKSTSHVAKLAQIKDNNAGFVSAGNMINKLIGDNRAMEEAIHYEMTKTMSPLPACSKSISTKPNVELGFV